MPEPIYLSDVHMDYQAPLVQLDSTSEYGFFNLSSFIRIKNDTSLDKDETDQKLKQSVDAIYNKLKEGINKYVKIHDALKLQAFFKEIKDYTSFIVPTLLETMQAYNHASMDPKVKVNQPLALTVSISIHARVDTALTMNYVRCTVETFQFNHLETTEWVYPQKHMFYRRNPLNARVFILDR